MLLVFTGVLQGCPNFPPMFVNSFEFEHYQKNDGCTENETQMFTTLTSSAFNLQNILKATVDWINENGLNINVREVNYNWI